MPVSKASARAITPAAKGDLTIGSGTNAASVLAVGSANQVLTVDSSTTTGLKWATPSSGGMTLITSGTIASGGLTLSSITNAYTDLCFMVYGVTWNTNSYYGLYFNNSTSGMRNSYTLGGTDSSTDYANAGSYLRFLTYNQTNANNVLIVYVRDYANTVSYKPISFSGSSYNGTSHMAMNGGGAIQTTSAIDRIDVINAPGGANFTAGSYKLWGIK